MIFLSIVQTRRQLYGFARERLLRGTPHDRRLALHAAALRSFRATNKVLGGMGKSGGRPLTPYMGHVVRLVLILGVGAIAYVWLTWELPGGEKRYEQYIRQVKDRHPINGI
jgi:hypothetical protein